ncbi:hypothetical protein CU098_011791 [Rhizopus stolonifer]|uniref:Uncharacterized protein n=1 Tax=Rhizopus stolonifer TaxID=4846 RepID=A0A367KUV8_RHIST|nr:hypothetical protein CU098_011791 [Rhizopus stolonifer]
MIRPVLKTRCTLTLNRYTNLIRSSIYGLIVANRNPNLARCVITVPSYQTICVVEKNAILWCSDIARNG